MDMETLTIEGNKRFYLRLRDCKEIDEYGERSNIIYFETDCDSYESRFLTDIYISRIIWVSENQKFLMK